MLSTDTAVNNDVWKRRLLKSIDGMDQKDGKYVRTYPLKSGKNTTHNPIHEPDYRPKNSIIVRSDSDDPAKAEFVAELRISRSNRKIAGLVVDYKLGLICLEDAALEALRTFPGSFERICPEGQELVKNWCFSNAIDWSQIPALVHAA